MTVNTEHLSRGWALIAEGAQYLSMAYASIEPPVPARETGVPASPAVSGAGVPTAAPRPSSVPPSFDEFPPAGYDDGPSTAAPEPALKPQVDTGLGKCPVHGVAWTIKAAGVSKAGKPFSAFWKCAERDANGYCNEKPQRIWQDIHKIPEGAAA